MIIEIFQVDAFTNQLFAGNPAAVCQLDEWLPDASLQAIAKENNLSETAYFIKKDDHYAIRWFSPGTEVELCGHATLASAFVIFNYLDLNATKLHFESGYGDLFVEKKDEYIQLNFPVIAYEEIVPLDKLLECLSLKPSSVYRSDEYLVVFDNEDQIKNLEVDLELMKELDKSGVIVTAPGRDCDFVSRYFGPKIDIPEDPVTGSAHCILTPYWAKQLGKNTFHAKQLSERGGEIQCELSGDRVLLSGQAVLFLRGVIHLKS